MLHAERTIEGLGGVFVQALAGDAFDEFAQQNEIRVAVDEAIAGRIHQRFVVDFPHQRVFAAERGGKWRIGRESGSVREQHANCDLVFAVRGELRHIARKRIVETNFAFLEETHDGRRRGEELGERGEIENRVGSHALAMRDERAFAECFAVNHMAAMADEKNASGDFAILDGGFDNRVENRKIGARRLLRGGSASLRGRNPFFRSSFRHG